MALTDLFIIEVTSHRIAELSTQLGGRTDKKRHSFSSHLKVNDDKYFNKIFLYHFMISIADIKWLSAVGIT